MTQPTDAKPMDAYVRVSAVGERGGDESYGSPTVQREAIERWLDYQRVPLGRVYVDEDQSGGTQNRPGLTSVIERALTGVTGGFAVYNISRFSRFTEGGLSDLRRLEEAGARIGFVQEQLDTSQVYGRMIFTILLATHEAALGQLKAGWKVVKARAISEGRQIGPTPPGYRRTTERNGRPKGSLVKDGPRGDAITAAYEAVAREGQLRPAVDILAAAFPTKAFVARKRATAERYGVELGQEVTVSATWNTTTARRVLASRVYLGAAFYGDEIEVNARAHEALIDGTTWRRVQRIIGIPQDARRAPAGDFPLSGGHAVCATCGFPLIGGRMGTDPRTGGGRRGYICNTEKRRDEHRCGAPARILAEPLEGCVRDLLVTHVRDLEEEGEPWPTLAEVGSYLADGAEFGPEDVVPSVAAARDVLEEAETEIAKIEALRGQLPEAALAAALAAQDRVVEEARIALEVARAGVPEERGLPDAVEISAGPDAELGNYLASYGLVAEVKPAFGDRRPGRVPERVRLVTADA